MYLSLLSGEQKLLFSSIAYLLASSDGVFSSDEQAVIDSYSMEMNAPFEKNRLYTDKKVIFEKINQNCDIREKKIIVFELIGLALADSDYGEKERTFIDDLINKIGISKEIAVYCEDKIQDYLAIQNQLNKFILG